jgi:hypothetical protein
MRNLSCLILFLFFLNCRHFAQQTVSGKVFSADSALAGVSVQVKGSSQATLTNKDGSF